MLSGSGAQVIHRRLPAIRSPPPQCHLPGSVPRTDVVGSGAKLLHRVRALGLIQAGLAKLLVMLKELTSESAPSFRIARRCRLRLPLRTLTSVSSALSVRIRSLKPSSE